MEQSASLRQPLNETRRVGVEIELSGLTETAVAGTVMFVLGGQLRPATKTRVVVADTELGDITIELDTKLDEVLAASPDNLLALARHVIPTELITAPISECQLPALDRLVRELRCAGAEGSGAGLAKGFGLHFNPEITDLRPAPVLRVLQSYALLEPWLRHSEPMTAARRVLPFTDPWPRGFARSADRPVAAGSELSAVDRPLSGAGALAQFRPRPVAAVAPSRRRKGQRGDR